MTASTGTRAGPATAPGPASRSIASAPPDGVFALLRTTSSGLTSSEAARRLAADGPNAVAVRRARAISVLWHQLRSPLLALLLAAAFASYFVGDRNDAVIIGLIVAVSIGLGFGNEYRAERAAESLHSQIRHRAVTWRDGRPAPVDVTGLVRGDVVELHLGDLVPADLRVIESHELECDESVLTGESLPVAKDPAPVAEGSALADLTSCAWMGTVVHAGSGRGVVTATGSHTEFGAIATGLSGRPMETAFQAGLRRFSMLLVYVAGTLTGSIFVINVALHRPLIDALLFSLAIAVGITPQLLPAIVSTSLAAGSRRMRKRRVLVKRLVCIEDLGDIDTLFTDKTGTLTEGRIRYMRARPAPGADAERLLRYGLACTDADVTAQGATGANPLDDALWASPAAAGQRAAAAGLRRLATLPFDHERRLVSVVLAAADGNTVLVTKGAPEAVFERSREVGRRLRDDLADEYAAGNRVVAVAARAAEPAARLTAADERDLEVLGLLVFLDPPKPDSADALRRLADLGVTVKVVTGDSAVVAVKVCTDLGLPAGDALTGQDVDGLDDAALARAIERATVFARVSPEHKARIVRVRRQVGGDVAFLGDGVNDALALHAADVGISVDSATDVAKDAADVILLEKDLDVLADGVAEGRRIFANTIKYVLMGTSSNFGNMFSAAAASIFLSFLPMLPGQILLNNLLYDTSQLTIPTDDVDAGQLRRPSHWDIGLIRRFMLFFGPLSSLFDMATFVVLLRGLHAGPAEFRSGWFVESLATQTLVIFVVRTRLRFWRSRPSLPLTLSALSAVVIGALLPMTPLAHPLGFTALPGRYFVVLTVLIAAYLALIELAKSRFYAVAARRPAGRPVAMRVHGQRQLRRRAAYFTRRSRRAAAARGTPPTSPARGRTRRRIPGRRSTSRRGSGTAA